MSNNVSLIVPIGGNVNVDLLKKTLSFSKKAGYELVIVADKEKSIFFDGDWDEVLQIARLHSDKLIFSPAESYFRRGSIWLKLLTGVQEATNPWVRFCGYDDFSYPSAYVSENLNCAAICTDVRINHIDSPEESILQKAPKNYYQAIAKGWRNPFSFIGWTIRVELLKSDNFSEVFLKGAFFFEKIFHIKLFSEKWVWMDATQYGGHPIRIEHPATISSDSKSSEFVELRKIAQSIGGYNESDRDADWRSLNVLHQTTKMMAINLLRLQ